MFVADILPTGFLAVQRAAVGPGDVTVVLGCGPVGLMALICAVGTARRVIAVDGIAGAARVGRGRSGPRRSTRRLPARPFRPRPAASAPMR